MDPVTAGPEAAFASAKIQLCLAGPIGTPAGAQLLFAFFDVNGVFTNPPNTADRIWRATFTPYVAGTPNPNPAGTTEGQALVPGRVCLSVKSKSLKRGRVIVSGKLLVDGRPYRGAVIELYVGTKKVGSGQDECGRATTRSAKKIKKKTRFVVADARARRPRAAVPGSSVTVGAAGLQDGDDLLLRLQHRHGKT